MELAFHPAMNGTEHKLSEQPHDHPGGRCSMIPKTKTWEEILGGSSGGILPPGSIR